MWVNAKNRHSFIIREKRHVDIFLKPQHRKQSIRTRLNSIYNKKNNPKRIVDAFFCIHIQNTDQNLKVRQKHDWNILNKFIIINMVIN